MDLKQIWKHLQHLEGTRDVPQCPTPTGGNADNGEGQAGGKVGGAAPEDGAEDGAGVEGAMTARQEA